MHTSMIRAMTPEDIPAIARWMVDIPLWQRYQLTEERARQQFEKAMTRQDILLAADAGAEQRACGFAWCQPESVFGRSVYLKLIGVQPGQTSAGLGSALLSAAEQKTLDYSKELFLLVSDFNHDAQRFYQRHGYQQIGAIPGYVLPDVAELIYWKRLIRAK